MILYTKIKVSKTHIGGDIKTFKIERVGPEP